jgi:hypothetical protein
MKSFYKIVAATVLMLFAVQCEVIDSDLLNSPNAVTPGNVDVDFLLNNIQLEFVAPTTNESGVTTIEGIYSGAAEKGGELVRYRRLFGSTYASAYQPQDLDAIHETAYASVLIDVQNLIPIAEENNQFFHIGMAQFFQAYTLITMVDMFGDMPYSEALDPSIFNPALDDDQSIYNEALNILDSAIANFQNEDRQSFPSDLYYPGETGQDKVDAWVRAANTLKLKAYLNMRHVDAAAATSGINEIMSDPVGPIVDPAQDFTFDYSTNDTNPDSRHPTFQNNYLNGGNDYIGVGFLHMLVNDKDDADPRIRYYIYRQTTQNSTNPAEWPCINANPPTHFNPSDPFCQIENGDGYWGQNHLNTEGIPPDNFLRSVFGIYPVGGEFDNSGGVDVDPELGYQGAGIRPILMSSFTHFMLAEAALTLDGVNLDPQALLNDAVTLSINTVADFGAPRVAALEAGAFAPTAATIQAYLDEVNAKYSADPLRTIAVEYYLAAFPNGLEAYNLLRRTGYPAREDGLQQAQNAQPGDFYRTFLYPASLESRNSNVSTKPSNLVRTFWDTRGEDTEFNF